MSLVRFRVWAPYTKPEVRKSFGFFIFSPLLDFEYLIQVFCAFAVQDAYREYLYRSSVLLVLSANSFHDNLIQLPLFAELHFL